MKLGEKSLPVDSQADVDLLVAHGWVVQTVVPVEVVKPVEVAEVLEVEPRKRGRPRKQ